MHGFSGTQGVVFQSWAQGVVLFQYNKYPPEGGGGVLGGAKQES